MEMFSDPVSRRVTPRTAAVALLTAGVVVAMLLSSGQMADLRVALPLLSRGMNWLEFLPLPLDMDHVVFFAMVACALRMLLPGVRWWCLLLGLGVLAAGTELLQFATVGRTPKLLDARDDMVGAGLGLLLGSVPLGLAAQASRLQGMVRGLVLIGVALLPVQQWMPLAALGLPLIASDLLFAGAIGVRALAWAGGAAPLRLSAFHAWLAAYLMAMGAAVLLLMPNPEAAAMSGLVCPRPSPSLSAGIFKWMGVLYLALLAVVVCDAARALEMQRRLAWLWIAAGLLVAVLSILSVAGYYLAPEAAWLQPTLNGYGSLPPGHYPRIHATFNYASMMCSFLIVAVCLLLWVREERRLGPRAFWIAMACLLIGVLPTLTPELGGVALVLGVGAWRMLRQRSPMTAHAALVIAVLLALLMLLAATRSMAAPLAESSQRWDLWQQAWNTLLEHPLRGVGLGAPVATLDFLAPSGKQQWLTDAHNLWLNVGGQAGLPAMLALAGLFGWLLRAGKTSAHGADGIAFWLVVAFVAAVLYSGLVGSFEDARHAWVLIGLLAALQVADHNPPQPVSEGER